MTLVIDFQDFANWEKDFVNIKSILLSTILAPCMPIGGGS